MATSVPQKDDVERWNVEQLAAWLQQVELADCCESTLKKGIDGHSFLQLTEEDLVLWGRDVSIRNRKQILRLVMQIKNQQLVGTGRQVIDIHRQNNSQGNWQNQHLNQQEEIKDSNNEDSASDSDDVDDFSSEDDFGSDTEQELTGLQPQEMHTGHDGGVQGDEDGLYMTPRTVTSTPNYPSASSRAPLNLPGRPLPTSTNPNHSQPPFLTTRHFPPQSSSGHPPPSRPPNYIPRNLQPPNRDVSLPGLMRGGIHHGTVSRIHGLSDHTKHGPPPADSSGHGPVPVLGLSQVSQIHESNLRQHIGRLNITPPLKKPKQPQNPPQKQKQNPPQKQQQNPPQKQQQNPPQKQQQNPPQKQQQNPPQKQQQNPPQKQQQNPPQKQQQNPPPQGSSPSGLAIWPPVIPHGSHSTNSPHNSRPVSPYESGGQGGKDGFSLHHPPLSASNSLEGNNSARPNSALAKVLQAKFTSAAQSASNAPEKTDHEYEIVDVPPRSFTVQNAENIGPNSSTLQSPDKIPPALPPRNQADSRDTVSRQGQGVGPQRQGLNVGNAKSHPVTSQGPPTIPPKWPPPSLPGFQNQPPSSNVTHNRQHDSSSEGFSFSQNRPPNKGSPNLNSNRPPMPTPAPNISGPAIGPPFAAGHPSGQYTELYPGPQHQIKPVDYHKSNEIPKEMAPALPGVPSTLPRIGQTSSMLINLQGGGSIELLPLYRRVMDQPYFYTISRAKSREILENADDGIFLIRPSTRSKDPLTLCLKHGGRIYNINIRHRRDGRFALGSEKSNEMAFSSIEEIIATHRREPIRLQSGERAILTASPPKNGHDYAEMSDIVQRN